MPPGRFRRSGVLSASVAVPARMSACASSFARSAVNGSSSAPPPGIMETGAPATASVTPESLSDKDENSPSALV